MKIIHLNTYATSGGASRAALRLHRAFRAAGHDSLLRFHFGSTNEPGVWGPTAPWEKTAARFRTWLDLRPLQHYPQRENPGWAINRIPGLLPESINRLQPDIVMLHGIVGGMLATRDLHRFHAPLVWTLHDMLPFTGGCNYAAACTRYEHQCGSCPPLHSERENDLTRHIWQEKNRAWNNLNLTAVAPSRWMASCAARSSLFKSRTIEVIPYTVDLTAYQPWEQEKARRTLGLPTTGKILLCGAMDLTGSPRKGFPQLLQALRQLKANGTVQRLHLSLAVFAPEMPELQGLPEIPIHFLGTLSRDHDLTCAYAAADLFAAPSLQDNLPNTVIESLACGTPAIAFNLGGFPDMIDHRVNGWLAAPLNIDALAEGIDWILSHPTPATLRHAARESALQRFDAKQVVNQHLDLFHRLISSNQQSARTRGKIST